MDALDEMRRSLSCASSLKPVTSEPAPASSSPKITRQKSGRSNLHKFELVEDEAERAAKAALVEKIERWLDEEVGIGGQEQRHFEPAELIKFAA